MQYHSYIYIYIKHTFYDEVSMIHDVITTLNPFTCTANFMFVGVKNNETQQIRR